MIAAGPIAVTTRISSDAQAQESVKWSAGIERPRTKVPTNAVDCHHHIYDSRFQSIRTRYCVRAMQLLPIIENCRKGSARLAI
jgi:hypothetical protein